ncbi:hypothetical protein [Frankia sp. EAN1pec]|uniref:hypothetical protein n=1 Tax=Parafrankia sp. (strain EAN1pec) TaxID=298653 RepID=UPI0002F4A46E
MADRALISTGEAAQKEDLLHHGKLARFRSRRIGVFAGERSGEQAMNGQFTVVVDVYRADWSGS